MIALLISLLVIETIFIWLCKRAYKDQEKRLDKMHNIALKLNDENATLKRQLSETKAELELYKNHQSET